MKIPNVELVMQRTADNNTNKIAYEHRIQNSWILIKRIKTEEKRDNKY